MRPNPLIATLTDMPRVENARGDFGKCYVERSCCEFAQKSGVDQFSKARLDHNPQLSRGRINVAPNDRSRAVDNPSESNLS
jgi:hypothetical protein